MSAMEGAQGVAAENSGEETYQNQCLKNGKKLYLNAMTADVHFTFGTVEDKSNRIPAHKNILAADSDVFEAMFYGNMKEPGDIHVCDATEAAFMEFLQYFYLSEVKLTVQNVVGVLHLGEKYDVEKCVNDCVQFLIRKLNHENVCAYMDVAILYDKEELMKVCEKRILLDTVAVFQTDGFLKCDKKVLSHILKMDVLSCSEVDVFEACMGQSQNWMRRNDLVESHLGNLYYHIRFASLTMEQLCSLQKQYESVLTRDFITIANIIVLPQFQPLKFTKCPRHAKWNTNAIIKCDRRIVASTDERDSHSSLNQTGEYRTFTLHREDEKVTFSASEPLILGHLTCGEMFAGGDDLYPCNVRVDMEISEASDLYDENSKMLLKMKIELEEDGTDILLPHPILIRPGLFYTIRVGPFPALHMCYSKFVKSEVQLESDVKVEFYYNNGISLIPELYFNKI